MKGAAFLRSGKLQPSLSSCFIWSCCARLTAPGFLPILDGNTSGRAVREEQKSLLLLQHLLGIWAKGLHGSMTSQGPDRHRQIDAGAACFHAPLFVFVKRKQSNRLWQIPRDQHLSDMFFVLLWFDTVWFRKTCVKCVLWLIQIINFNLLELHLIFVKLKKTLVPISRNSFCNTK